MRIDRIQMIRNIKMELAGIKKPVEMAEKEYENPCWDGYEQIGTKIKDGVEVPNCVPIKEEQSKVKEGFPVPSPSGGEDEQTYVSRCISEIIGEYGQEQAAAICYTKWREE